jgi:hypothetical protein
VTLSALLLAGLCGGRAQAYKIAMPPHPAFVLRGSATVIMQDSESSAILYFPTNGQLVQRFSFEQPISRLAVTGDEQFLLAAFRDGALALWDVTTGAQVWQKSASETGVSRVVDANFANDGKSFVVADGSNFTPVFATKTGDVIRNVGDSFVNVEIHSAALSPTGSTAVVLEGRPSDPATANGERLILIDLVTGATRDTGVKGERSVRYSSDGKHIACVVWANATRSSEKLRVIAADGPPKMVDVGAFSWIGRLWPDESGGFLMTGLVSNPTTGKGYVVGARFSPTRGSLEELWRMSSPGVEGGKEGAWATTHFRPKQLVGACTDYRFVTQLTDLKTGTSLQTIDNSPNYRASPGTHRLLAIVVVGAFLGVGGLVGVVVLVYVCTRRK